MKINTFIFLLLLTFSLLAIGCTPRAVDISNSESLVLWGERGADSFNYDVTIHNNAVEPKSDIAIFGSTKIVMKMQEMPQETVEKDIKLFFQKAKINEKDLHHISVTINRAESYFIDPAINSIPFTGIVTMWVTDYAFVFDIDLNFKIDKGGKLIDAFSISGKFVIPDGDINDAEGSYRRVVTQYRQVIFKRLEDKLNLFQLKT